MTIRNILVPVADRPECPALLDSAIDYAKALNANISGVHLIPSPSGGNFIRHDAAAARKLFEAHTTRHDVPLLAKPAEVEGASGYWSEIKGSPDHVMPLIGRVADMIMVSRPKSGKAKIARDIMVDAILTSGKPVFLLPHNKKIKVAKHVAVAWDRGIEAARALQAAIPILQAAEKVTLIEAGYIVKEGPKASRVATSLKWHGIKADVHICKSRDAVEFQITDAIRQLGANMLVMGGYSRARFREILFGGTTRYMISETSLPLFLLH